MVGERPGLTADDLQQGDDAVDGGRGDEGLPLLVTCPRATIGIVPSISDKPAPSRGHVLKVAEAPPVPSRTQRMGHVERLRNLIQFRTVMHEPDQEKILRT